MHVTGTVPPTGSGPAGDPRGPADTTGHPGRHVRRLGLPVTTALVMGNVIGGVLLLPASVARTARSACSPSVS